MKTISKVMIPALLLASTSAFAGLELHFTTQNNAAWVKVTDNDQPVAGATVTTDHTGNESFITDEQGRTYIFIPEIHSSAVNFTATDDAGQTVSKKQFIKNEK
ncbi:hypothetical protein [Photobacterium rosenbergii]|uniref:Bacterial Ig domain-containing protein n=1 Tax=Photobacterium rosenbergii TaxID=294936 RepID=A0ABU3ZEM3_9GAMM|nr:hypothetical protein [Photobacterium rosenbergii]MDV5168554.1 hypothetical protein [Photobacterium rosenbergii]